MQPPWKRLAGRRPARLRHKAGNPSAAESSTGAGGERPHGEQSRRFARLGALMVKEGLQVLRDPSSLMIAFGLPTMLLWLFANAISLDIDRVHFGVALEGGGQAAYELAAAYGATPYFEARPARHRRQLDALMASGEIRGYVLIPANFDRDLAAGGAPQIQVITDATEPNTAKFIGGYAQGVLGNWLADRSAAAGRITMQQRFWYNPELNSRQVLIPGGIAIIMTMIGTLLTALVISREWERGTMEGLMSTPASMVELLLSKLAPYFLLGMLATLGCTFMAVTFYGVPLRGSLAALMTVSAVFLLPALGQGLLISTLTKSQFTAAQAALFAGFMPALILSGYLFEIDAMPAWLQAVTHLVPARHYVPSLQSIFLAGDLWPQMLRDMAALLALGLAIFALTLRRVRKSLD